MCWRWSRREARWRRASELNNNTARGTTSPTRAIVTARMAERVARTVRSTTSWIPSSWPASRRCRSTPIRASSTFRASSFSWDLPVLPTRSTRPPLPAVLWRHPSHTVTSLVTWTPLTVPVPVPNGRCFRDYDCRAVQRRQPASSRVTWFLLLIGPRRHHPTLRRPFLGIAVRRHLAVRRRVGEKLSRM